MFKFFLPIDIYGILINCFFSLQRVVIGVVIAVLVGIFLGFIRSSLPPRMKHSYVLRFLLEAPKFPPPIAWIPFVLLIFGIGEKAAWAIVFIGAFAPIFTSAYEGAENVPNIICNTARSLGLSGGRFLFLIILPASLPRIFTGIRVGLGMGWMSVIAAEMVSGQSGLGYSIQLNRLNLQYGLVFIDIVLVGLIGFLLFEGLTYLEKFFLPWHEKSNKSQ